MNLQKLLAFTFVFVLTFGMQQAFAQSSSDAGDTPATYDALAISPPQPCIGGETDLLIQDAVPWPFFPVGIDTRGAFVNELIEQGKSWCAIDSSEIGTTNLSQFSVIILASDQPDSFYSNIMPGGVIHPDIDNWVLSGGILSASLADKGHNFGNWDGSSFAGGLTKVSDFPEDLTIVTPAHPLIANGLTCPSGNCAVIVDIGSRTDIDDFTSSAHAFFTNLPVGTTVILSSASGPVAIEYSHGAGTVIANTLTDAWMYQGNNGPPVTKFIANDIAYQNSIGTQKVGGEFLPINTTALLVAGIQTNAVWILTALAGIASAAFGTLYITSKRN